jgi:hypothetical protein
MGNADIAKCPYCDVFFNTYEARPIPITLSFGQQAQMRENCSISRLGPEHGSRCIWHRKHIADFVIVRELL